MEWVYAFFHYNACSIVRAIALGERNEVVMEMEKGRRRRINGWKWL